MLEAEAGVVGVFSVSKILAASCASTKFLAVEGEFRGRRCLVMNGGMDRALVMKTGLGPKSSSFACCTPSSVVTILSVAQDGHSTSLLCNSALEANFIGIAALLEPNSPKCS